MSKRLRPVKKEKDFSEQIIKYYHKVLIKHLIINRTKLRLDDIKAETKL
jgi:hypothetical protein